MPTESINKLRVDFESAEYDWDEFLFEGDVNGIDDDSTTPPPTPPREPSIEIKSDVKSAKDLFRPETNVANGSSSVDNRGPPLRPAEKHAHAIAKGIKVVVDSLKLKANAAQEEPPRKKPKLTFKIVHKAAKK